MPDEPSKLELLAGRLASKQDRRKALFGLLTEASVAREQADRETPSGKDRSAIIEWSRRKREFADKVQCLRWDLNELDREIKLLKAQVAAAVVPESSAKTLNDVCVLLERIAVAVEKGG